MYSAVEDRTVHLRLPDEASRTPVHQEIARKSDGKEVAAGAAAQGLRRGPRSSGDPDA
jgi:hypothetical protein